MGSEIVIGSESSGLIFKNGEAWDQFNTSNSELPDNHILSIEIDDEYNIWIGTYNEGLCKINLQNSILEHLDSQIYFYPNPVKSGGEIHFNRKTTGHISLCNELGEFIDINYNYNGDNYEIPKNIQPGIYVIKLFESGHLINKKILVTD